MTLHETYIELRELLVKMTDDDTIPAKEYLQTRDTLYSLEQRLAEQGIQVEAFNEDDYFCNGGWDWDDESGMPTPNGHHWVVMK